MSSPLLSSITNTPFKSLRRFRSLSLTSSGFVNATPATSSSGDSLDGMGDTTVTDISEVDRGTIVVSWYEGTTSSEMTEHVFNCVLRKLNSSDSSSISSVPIGGKKKNGSGKIKLEDVRLLDDQEEVVLCPFLPDGSSFLLKFKIAFERPATPPRYRLPPAYVSEAPDSPSAEPSPHPSSADLPSIGNKESDKQRQYLMQQNSKIEQQNEQTQQMLGAVAALLQQQQSGGGLPPHLNLNALLPNLPSLPEMPSATPQQISTSPKEEKKEEDEPHTPIKNRLMPPTMAPISENSTTDQAIEHQLRQLNELFMQRRSSSVVTQSNEDTAKAMNGTDENMVRAYHRDEKKQVIFVIANYLVLFMAMIAMSAEIQSRLPRWMEWVQQNYDSVQNCATDQAALMECLARGDLSGLIASFVLWATQSVFAQRIFLFGFDTPKKLWTVVYEALVTAVCWGISYLFIRRGLNPNTRQNFVHKYWKDAVYGSLAGFNAAFMKAVLKNLVPQDVALEALEGRQLRIFHWLGSFLTTEGLE